MRDASSKRPATLKDVALAAGVSTATVSMILNRRYQFKPELEARVREAIVALNYRQNPVARSMATGLFGSIGLVVLDIRNPHFTNIVHGASIKAQEHGYNLIVVDLKEDVSHARQTLDDLARRVDGLILSLRLPQEARDLPLQLGKPAVLFGQTLHEPAPAPLSPSIQIRGWEAAMLLGRHIFEAGRKRLTYVGYSRSIWNADRINALRTLAEGAGAEVREVSVAAQTMEAGEAVAASLIYDAWRTDAIVCYNDMVAIGLLHGLCALGVRVPDDIMIAGFDNIPVSRYVTPSLTTVDMRSEDLGGGSLERLHRAIQSGDHSPGVELLEPRLVVRASTLAQRGGEAGAPR
ncbi:MAG: LacI family DNA-binding transcriptional regulator [Candidatus Dactylopiibacterium sp.]|nr:LacI family DNA-binding transcriptional regulator [Candidatus Dactylopiibacterium sp.]